jgi:hypothetical protein
MAKSSNQNLAIEFFEHYLKIFNGLMDNGSISAIDLMIEIF